MALTIDKPAILKLSLDERLRLLDLIIETLEFPSPGMPMGPDLAELERRLEEARANPDDGMTIEQFKVRLRMRRSLRQR